MITRFTFTGADDSVQPKDLSVLQKTYPFIEWGILVARNNFGRRRFPSLEWLQALTDHAENSPFDLRLSMHLCGSYVNEFMLGEDKVASEVACFDHMGLFSRVQINTHGFPHDFDPKGIVGLLRNYPDKQFIFQYDNQNHEALYSVIGQSPNVAALFDLSHGAGVLPSEWPALIPKVFCGYAGGLSPVNLDEQIQKIESIVGDTPIWIDIETHVRSDSDRRFDLDKVVECCEIASKYILQ